VSTPEIIPCDHVIAQLWEFIDGEISDERAGLIRAHLDVCAHCFPQYNFQRAFVEFVHVHGQTPIPPPPRPRVFETLLREDARPADGEDPASR